LNIRYSATSGKKGFEVDVNGLKYSGVFPHSEGDDFSSYAVGRVELTSGRNRIAIEHGWGHSDIDAIDLTPVSCPPAPAKPPKSLVDPQTIPEARALFEKLVDAYGDSVFSGVYSIDDEQFVRQRTSASPAIIGGDLMDYTPSRIARGAKPGQAVEDLLAQARASGAIATISWHWNAPKDLVDRVLIDERGREIDARWYKGFNSNATTFDLAKAMSDLDSEERRLLVADIDVIAVQLGKFAEVRIPVLWRPLHEAEGRWFWWGAKGPAPFKLLWRMLFDRLTHHHHLHNLIWVYTGGPERDWYPGDDVVDIVGVDAYPDDVRDPLSGAWDDVLRQYAGRKLLALTEFGGVPDIERMRRHGVYWAYFVSWTGRMGPRAMSDETLKKIYLSPQVSNRGTAR
jgi:mannan endo-1,4-beta-mannosidase